MWNLFYCLQQMFVFIMLIRISLLILDLRLKIKFNCFLVHAVDICIEFPDVLIFMLHLQIIVSSFSFLRDFMCASIEMQSTQSRRMIQNFS